MESEAPKDKNNHVEEVPRNTYGFVKFILMTILQKKKYWLLPFWCLLLAIAIILFLTGNGALLPAIYMAF